MSTYIVDNYDGWLYDTDLDSFLSPSGRIAKKPGGAFKGQFSSEAFLDAVSIAAKEEFNVFYDTAADDLSFIEPETEDDDMSIDEYVEENHIPTSCEVVEEDGIVITAKTYEVGSVTINIVDVD